MKPRPFRSAVIALITVLSGSCLDYMTGFETKLGLDTLFQMRGIRQPPAKVVVVAMDETSEIRLNLGQDLTRWRDVHAALIRQLQRQGASLIVFDLQFIASQPDHDPVLAKAIRDAGNVLITDCVQKFRRGSEDFYGRDECSENNRDPMVEKEGESERVLSDRLVTMRKIAPARLLSESALDHAPFYLINDARNPTVRETWTFYDPLAETPSLPVVAWLHYLQRTGAVRIADPPAVPMSDWLTDQRRQCLSIGHIRSIRSANVSLVTRITDIVCREVSRYLDYYGPPQTIRMESYSDVYEGKVTGLQGKAVFVGKANRRYSPGKTDFFQTPFTDTRSGKMAGVEIMATQFANLLEGRFVTSPLPPGVILLSFGLAVGLILIQLSALPATMVSLLFGGAYACLSFGYFHRNGWWLPAAVPLLIQFPLSWLIALAWSRHDLLAERRRILAFARQVFPQWLRFLPASPGQWSPEKNIVHLASERHVRGLCLATDIEDYTSVAEQHTSLEMWALLKAYYRVLGYPVSSHEGIIANIQGDAMMAIWIDLPPDIRRRAACLAALEIEQEVERFNETSSVERLPTRIGLHEGDMVLGSGESGGFKFYNPFGDTVNTASRIQGVNKYLGTRILASEEIADSLSGVIHRPVGAFRVVGRSEPLKLVEIVGKDSDGMDSKKFLYEQFADSLELFRQGEWSRSAAGFDSLLDRFGHDGPSRYYLDLALTFQNYPPPGWDGVITLAGK
ncbi:MAG: CHASE2 domain-containing protein [Gammaproteobacteria bacterium]